MTSRMDRSRAKIGILGALAEHGPLSPAEIRFKHLKVSVTGAELAEVLAELRACNLVVEHPAPKGKGTPGPVYGLVTAPLAQGVAS